jgi:hypothetical protein
VPPQECRVSSEESGHDVEDMLDNVVKYGVRLRDRDGEKAKTEGKGSNQNEGGFFVSESGRVSGWPESFFRVDSRGYPPAAVLLSTLTTSKNEQTSG